MTINISFCIDENYVCQLGAALCSLVQSNSQNEISVYVLSNDLKLESKIRLRNVISNTSSFSLTFINSTDEQVKKLTAGGHISAATYIRFELPDRLFHLKKVLYLDADLIISDDLSSLWNVDIGNNFVGAVENPFFDRYSSLGMSSKFGYFNAGVLLINLSLWRKNGVKDHVIDFLISHKKEAIMYDQDALNATFKGHWFKLPLRWNLQTPFLRRKRDLPDLKVEINDAFMKPGIVHYSTSSKPWDLFNSHPLKYLFKFQQSNFGKVAVPILPYSMLRGIIKWGYMNVVFSYQIGFLTYFKSKFSSFKEKK